MHAHNGTCRAVGKQPCVAPPRGVTQLTGRQSPPAAPIAAQPEPTGSLHRFCGADFQPAYKGKGRHQTGPALRLRPHERRYGRGTPMSPFALPMPLYTNRCTRLPS